VIALLIAINIYTKKLQKARAMKFGNYETLKKVSGESFIQTSYLLEIIKLGGVSMLILGVSGPQLVQEENVADASYVIALDSSSSMFTSDISPTRFDSAKDIGTGIIDEMTNNTQLGIISYSGDVNVESEVSPNIGEERRSLRNVTIGDTAGTAIGDAIISSGTLLENQERKRIVLMTDGENNVGSSINESLRYAQNQNISIYTIGLGTNQSREQFGTVRGENASRADFPNLNVNQLRKLSNQTGGESVFVSENTEIEPEFVGIEREDIETDISNLFVFLGCLFLITEWALKSTGLEVIP
jgi:Ca-activated chloride channel family protein